MVFGQPDIVKTCGLGAHHLVETGVIKLGIVALPLRRITKVVPQAKAQSLVAHGSAPIFKKGAVTVVTAPANGMLQAAFAMA